MTDRTSTSPTPRHALKVLEGGLRSEGWPLDGPPEPMDAARLAEEIAEAASLCDRLEADGLRIAFELDGTKPGVRVSVRDAQGRERAHLRPRQVTELRRLPDTKGLVG